MSKSPCKILHPADWNRPRLHRILREIQGKRILVLGDVGVDRYTKGAVTRISPEAPVPIVAVEEETLKLGLAANVADNIKTLGGVPYISGLVGKDRFASDLHMLFKSVGIAPRFLVADSSRRTTLKERIVSDGQQLLRVDFESRHPITPQLERKIMQQVFRALPSSDAVVIEDYAKGVITPNMAKAVFARARKLKRYSLVDPNVATPAQVYRGADILTPNVKEAEALSGVKIQDEESLVKAGRAILKLASARYVVVTRGKEGMAIFSARNPEVRLIPTYAREVYDVSGAGDTVISVLALALSAGATIEDACILGNLAAGVEVGKRGTATVTTDEIQVAMEFFSASGV